MGLSDSSDSKVHALNHYSVSLHINKGHRNNLEWGPENKMLAIKMWTDWREIKAAGQNLQTNQNGGCWFIPKFLGSHLRMMV